MGRLDLLVGANLLDSREPAGQARFPYPGSGFSVLEHAPLPLLPSLFRPLSQECAVPIELPGPQTRWRCNVCGNLTRFDVVRTVRSRDFVHVDLAGEDRSRSARSSPRCRARDLPVVRRAGRRRSRAPSGRGGRRPMTTGDGRDSGAVPMPPMPETVRREIVAFAADALACLRRARRSRRGCAVFVPSLPPSGPGSAPQRWLRRSLGRRLPCPRPPGPARAAPEMVAAVLDDGPAPCPSRPRIAAAVAYLVGSCRPGRQLAMPPARRRSFGQGASRRGAEAEIARLRPRPSRRGRPRARASTSRGGRDRGGSSPARRPAAADPTQQ